MIRWFANNGIAANFLMLGILVAGLYTAIYRIPLEVTPTSELGHGHDRDAVPGRHREGRRACDPDPDRGSTRGRQRASSI